MNRFSRGDKVHFEAMGAVPRVLEGEAIRFIPRGESIASHIVKMYEIRQLPARRRRFKDVSTKNDRYLVAVYRKNKNGELLNSVDYYAPIAERVKKHD